MNNVQFVLQNQLVLSYYSSQTNKYLAQYLCNLRVVMLGDELIDD